MAYEIYIASLTDDLIIDLSGIKHPNHNSSIPKGKARVENISHYFVSNTAELGLDFDKVLVSAIENGKDLDFWHPLRPPRFYLSQEVLLINKNLKAEWRKVLKNFSMEYLEYHIMDFQPVFDLYDYSEANNYGIISFLNKPYDSARADRVIYPVEINEPTPPTW